MEEDVVVEAATAKPRKEQWKGKKHGRKKKYPLVGGQNQTAPDRWPGTSGDSQPVLGPLQFLEPGTQGWGTLLTAQKAQFKQTPSNQAHPIRLRLWIVVPPHRRVFPHPRSRFPAGSQNLKSAGGRHHRQHVQPDQAAKQAHCLNNGASKHASKDSQAQARLKFLNLHYSWELNVAVFYSIKVV